MEQNHEFTKTRSCATTQPTDSRKASFRWLESARSLLASYQSKTVIGSQHHKAAIQLPHGWEGVEFKGSVGPSLHRWHLSQNGNREGQPSTTKQQKLVTQKNLTSSIVSTRQEAVPPPNPQTHARLLFAGWNQPGPCWLHINPKQSLDPNTTRLPFSCLSAPAQPCT